MAQRKEKKKTKKKAVLAGVILVVIVAVIAVAAILWNRDRLFGTLETGDITEVDILDSNSDYSSGEQQSTAEEACDFCEKLFAVIFNFNSDTEDYTEELTGYYGTDEELFAGNNSDIMGNIYKEFSLVNMESEYTGFTMDSLEFIESDNLCISVIGRVAVDASTEDLEENSYSFPVNIILLKPGDEWQVYYIEIEKMYETDGLSMEIEDLGDGNSTVDYTGNEVFTLDFDDYDSFAELYGG